MAEERYPLSWDSVLKQGAPHTIPRAREVSPSPEGDLYTIVADMMTVVRIRSAVAPLVSGATYRRAVFLLLGGVIALPYALVGVAFWQAWTSDDTERALVLLLFGLAAAVAVVPAFLPATRTLEIVATRGLLGTDIPHPTHGVLDRETRMRSALWFAIHVVIGGLVSGAVVVTVPMALVFVTQQVGLGDQALFELGPLGPDDTAWWTLIGLGLLFAIAYSISALGALAAQVAPALLGPSPDERIAALEARTAELAERNRLARELHDSVGHALTVTTLQAAAARQVIDTDPEFVRRALVAVEESGRAAMEDLDHVLGLLRDTRRTAPLRTLSDVDRLVADAATAGVQVTLTVDGDLDSLPAPLSREGYRIVQESLTNVARHVGRTDATLSVSVGTNVLQLDITNPITGRSATRSAGGRGLNGMRERVTFLGGRITAGPDENMWRVAVQLPLGRGGMR